ncbi:MAG: type II secretion system protein GspJ [Bdellovibrionales bacterium]
MRITKQGGFTLLEVLIAITILAGLAALTSQSIIKSSKDKARLQKEIDRDSKLQNAVRLIERDINLAFHYRDLNEEIEKAVKLKSQKGNTATGAGVGNPGAPPAPPTDPDDPSGQGKTPGGATGTPNVPLDFEPKKYEQLTQFLGTDQSMHFTTLSHIRLMQDSPESEQSEVGYYLEVCKPRNSDKEAMCLWRRSSPYIDKEVDKGGASTVLLENVKTFKLKYFGEDKLDWVSTWKSTQGMDEAATDKFPLAVELTLTAEDQGKESTLSAIIPIHFPNNKPKEEVDPLAGATTGGAGATGAPPPPDRGGS